MPPGMRPEATRPSFWWCRNAETHLPDQGLWPCWCRLRARRACFKRLRPRLPRRLRRRLPRRRLPRRLHWRNRWDSRPRRQPSLRWRRHPVRRYKRPQRRRFPPGPRLRCRRPRRQRPGTLRRPPCQQPRRPHPLRRRPAGPYLRRRSFRRPPCFLRHLRPQCPADHRRPFRQLRARQPASSAWMSSTIRMGVISALRAARLRVRPSASMWTTCLRVTPPPIGRAAGHSPRPRAWWAACTLSASTN